MSGIKDYPTFGSGKQYNVYCMRCGFKCKSNDIVVEEDLRGKGLRVCKTCFDGEHPQDFVTGMTGDISVPHPFPFDGAQEFYPLDPPIDMDTV